MTPITRKIFSRSDWPEAQRVAGWLRDETVGGALLLIATVAALVWANSPWHTAYTDLSHAHVGIASWGFDLDLAHWSADGLLAIFFFVVGMELKHEFRHGDLRDPAKATVPIVAAVCGVALPAVIYTLVQFGLGGDTRGWAIPTATDIAFALAVLAVIGTHLPSALRSFLLTLAVVDDLIAITIIAIFFSHGLDLRMLAAAAVAIAAFGVAAQRAPKAWLLLPLAVLAWAFMFKSGIHATIAGVVLGLLVPTGNDGTSLAYRLDRRIHPFSAGFCVPVFAFFAAGVTLVGEDVGAAVTDPVTVGIVVALVAGKAIGIFSATFLTARFTKAELDDDLAWSDLFGLSLLAGIGFTVSLLIGELAFGAGSESDDHVKLGVLTGSLVAALAATVVLRLRNRVYRRIHEDETRDADGDGIPDVYQDAGRTTTTAN